MEPRNDERAIADAERTLAAAHLAFDLATINHLLHRNYVNLQLDGSTEGKADLLASLHSGQRHWDHAEVDQLEIQVYGDAAVVVGRWRASGQNGAVKFDYAARFLSIWVREDRRWQNVAYQATEFPLSP